MTSISKASVTYKLHTSKVKNTASEIRRLPKAAIMRAFVRPRQILSTNKELAADLDPPSTCSLRLHSAFILHPSAFYPPPSPAPLLSRLNSPAAHSSKSRAQRANSSPANAA